MRKAIAKAIEAHATPLNGLMFACCFSGMCWGVLGSMVYQLLK